jgi:hypothetical protein
MADNLSFLSELKTEGAPLCYLAHFARLNLDKFFHHIFVSKPTSMIGANAAHGDSASSECWQLGRDSTPLRVQDFSFPPVQLCRIMNVFLALLRT